MSQLPFKYDVADIETLGKLSYFSFIIIIVIIIIADHYTLTWF